MHFLILSVDHFLIQIRITSLAHSRKTMRIARLATQRDDVHLCIMCLRAIMNYQVVEIQDTASQKIILKQLYLTHLFLFF